MRIPGTGAQIARHTHVPACLGNNAAEKISITQTIIVPNVHEAASMTDDSILRFDRSFVYFSFFSVRYLCEVSHVQFPIFIRDLRWNKYSFTSIRETFVTHETAFVRLLLSFSPNKFADRERVMRNLGMREWTRVFHQQTLLSSLFLSLSLHLSRFNLVKCH